MSSSAASLSSCTEKRALPSPLVNTRLSDAFSATGTVMRHSPPVHAASPDCPPNSQSTFCCVTAAPSLLPRRTVKVSDGSSVSYCVPSVSAGSLPSANTCSVSANASTRTFRVSVLPPTVTVTGVAAPSVGFRAVSTNFQTPFSCTASASRKPPSACTATESASGTKSAGEKSVPSTNVRLSPIFATVNCAPSATGLPSCVSVKPPSSNPP